LSTRTLTDAQWARIEGLLPGRAGLPGRRGVDNRRFADAVLWLARTAAPWRDLPPAFGTWTGVHARAPRRALAGVRGRLSHALRADPDVEYVLIDSTICKARGGCDERKGGRRRRGSDAHAAA
jgi:transposase